jgi:hypothetical protein
MPVYELRANGVQSFLLTLLFSVNSFHSFLNPMFPVSPVEIFS